MASNKVPEGMESAIPYLTVDNATEAIEFYKRAFGAQELRISPAPDGKKVMHAQIKIGNSVIYLSDDFPEYCGGKSRTPKALGDSPVTIHQYVEDCDDTVKRAAEAGATVVLEPMDAFWGDRYGVITDPFGHHWSFATHQRDVTPEEMAKAAEDAFKMTS